MYPMQADANLHICVACFRALVSACQ
jgi:hypothetical protein